MTISNSNPSNTSNDNQGGTTMAAKKTALKNPVPGDLHLPFQALETELRKECFERREETHTAVLALLGRQHHFVLGAPGTAKSHMVNRLALRIEGAEIFNILMTRFSQPEETFGGPNVKTLAETGRFERVSTGMLPEADIAFLDEVFKANAAILNSLLMAINERKYVRSGGDVVDIPLHSVFAASNELATSDELAAMWDRIHYRHYTSPLQESSNFIAMLDLEVTPTPEKLLTLDQLHAAFELVKQVEIPQEVMEAVVSLKASLLNDKIEVSDRRWREAVRSIRAESFYHGRMVAQVSDTRQLMHFLWQEPDQIKIVRRLVLELANPMEREAAELLDALVEAYAQYKESKKQAENKSARGTLTVEIFKKIEKTKTKFVDLRARQVKSGVSSDVMDELGDKIISYGNELLSDLSEG